MLGKIEVFDTDKMVEMIKELNRFEFREGGGKERFVKLLKQNNLCVLCGESFPRTLCRIRRNLW